MQKFRGLRKTITSIFLCGAIICVSAGGVNAASNVTEKNSRADIKSVFTTQITDLDKKYIDEVQNDVETIKAYEVDVDGNKKEVTPLSQRKSKSVDNLSSTLVPNDGFVYTYIDYDLYYDSGSYDRWFSKVGSVYFENRSYTDTWTLKYTQQSSTSTTWRVSGNLEANGEAGLKFISKLTVKLGFSVARDKTWYESQTVENSLTVQPRKWAQISKYTGGRQGNGAMVYEKRSPAGSLLGLYYESAGGWAVSPTEISWAYDSGSL